MEQNLTRREARENAFLAAFSATFHPDDPQPVLLNQPESHEHPLDEFSLRILRDMEAHSEEIDDVIRANLKGWTIARVPRVSLVALRVALAEMMYGEEKRPALPSTKPLNWSRSMALTRTISSSTACLAPWHGRRISPPKNENAGHRYKQLRNLSGRV